MNQLAYLIPIAALAGIAIEMAVYALRRRAYPWRDAGLSGAVFILRIPANLLRGAILAPIALFAWNLRIATVPLDTAWGVALLFVGTEFCYYWSHRWGHQVRWMWASHAVHHTPTRLNLVSALRLGATETLSGMWLAFIPLYVLGFHPLAVAGALALNLAYQFWLHTELIGKLGPLEWVFNTPSHHRVHHASNAEYLDRNFGGIVIVWDRLFGTFAEERADHPPRFGLVHPVPTANPLRILFQQWIHIARDVRRSRDLPTLFRQLVGRPSESLAETHPERSAP